MYTLFINLRYILATIIICGGQPAWGQTNPRQLDQYIATAFAQNQGLKQQQFDLDKSLAGLQEAKAMYLPTVSLLGSFQKAGGGRSIDLPLGNLLNPVYTGLNQVNPSFKTQQLSNQSFLFNADNYYDAKVRTSLPLVNAEIWYNKQIKQEMITRQQAEVNVYKRALVKDIKSAYYHYYQALQGIAIYNSEMSLIKENIRENESMLRNGTRNGTALLRSQTEQQKTNAAIIQAIQNTRNAQAYFNFLLNRPLQDTVIIDREDLTPLTSSADTSAGVSKREELGELRTVQRVYALDFRLQKSGIIPKLNTFIDLGSEGFNLNANTKTSYYFWGINLQWDIFTGGQRKYRAQQSQENILSANAKFDETEKQLQLQLDQSFNNYQAANASYHSSEAQLTFAGKYYNDQLKAYRAGQLLYIELIDAQNQLTTARLQLADAQAALQIAVAELEREQSTYPINQSN